MFSRIHSQLRGHTSCYIWNYPVFAMLPGSVCAGYRRRNRREGKRWWAEKRKGWKIAKWEEEKEKGRGRTRAEECFKEAKGERKQKVSWGHYECNLQKPLQEQEKKVQKMVAEVHTTIGISEGFKKSLLTVGCGQLWTDCVYPPPWAEFSLLKVKYKTCSVITKCAMVISSSCTLLFCKWGEKNCFVILTRQAGPI